MSYDTTSTIPDYFRTLYQTNWNPAIQQEQSLLLRTVMTEQHNEQKARINFWEKAKPLDEKEGRLQQTTLHEGTGKFRWISSKDYAYANVLDEFDADKLASMVAPNSEMIRNQIISYNQQIDTILINAVTASVEEGKTGGTTVAWDPTHTVAETFHRDGTTTASGFTWDKIVRVRRLFKDNYVMVNPATTFAVISPTQEEDMLADIEELKSSDYTRTIPVIPEGNLDGKTWMGFTWIVHPMIQANGSGITEALFYTKDSIVFNPGVRKNTISQRPDLSDAVQLRTSCYMGAVRKYDESVFTVKSA